MALDDNTEHVVSQEAEGGKTYKWPKDELGHLIYANAFAVQYNAEQLEVFLWIGSVEAPLSDTEDTVDSNVTDVRPIVRIALTPIKVMQLADILRRTMEALHTGAEQLVKEQEAAQQSHQEGSN